MKFAQALIVSFILIMNANSDEDVTRMCRDLSALCQKIDNKGPQTPQSPILMCKDLSVLCQKIETKSSQSSPSSSGRPLPQIPKVLFQAPKNGPFNPPLIYKIQDKLKAQNFLKENLDAILRMNNLSYDFVKGAPLRTKEEEAAMDPKELVKIRQTEKISNAYVLAESTKELERLKSEGWEVKGFNGLEGKYNEYPDLSGFVAYNQKKNLMVVAFHGTTNKAAWSNNYDATKMLSFDLRRVYIKDSFTYLIKEVDRNIKEFQVKSNKGNRDEALNRAIANLSDLKKVLLQRQSIQGEITVDSIRYITSWIENKNAQTSDRILKDILGDLARYCRIKAELIDSIDTTKINISGQVHSGFLKKYYSAKEQLIKTMKVWLDTMTPDRRNSLRIIFTGHSQAGALGLLALSDIGANHGRELFGEGFDNTKMNNFGAYLLSVPRAGDEQFRDWLHQKIGKENILRQNVHGDLVPIASADEKLSKTIKKLPALGELFEELGDYANDVGFFIFDDPIDAWHRAKDYYVKVVGRSSTEYTLLDSALRTILGRTFAAIILEPEKTNLTSRVKGKIVGAVGLGGIGIKLTRILAGSEKAEADLIRLLTERFSHLHYLVRIKEIEKTHFSPLIINRDLDGMLVRGLEHQQNKQQKK